MNITIWGILSIIAGVIFVVSIIVMIACHDSVDQDIMKIVMFASMILCVGFIFLNYVTGAVETLSEAIHQVYCESCGGIMEDTDKYCPECGEPYSRDTCDYCMSAIDKNQKFCGECGKQISE